MTNKLSSISSIQYWVSCIWSIGGNPSLINEVHRRDYYRVTWVDLCFKRMLVGIENKLQGGENKNKKTRRRGVCHHPDMLVISHRWQWSGGREMWLHLRCTVKVRPVRFAQKSDVGTKETGVNVFVLMMLATYSCGKNWEKGYYTESPRLIQVITEIRKKRVV